MFTPAIRATRNLLLHNAIRRKDGGRKMPSRDDDLLKARVIIPIEPCPSTTPHQHVSQPLVLTFIRPSRIDMISAVTASIACRPSTVLSIPLSW